MINKLIYDSVCERFVTWTFHYIANMLWPFVILWVISTSIEIRHLGKQYHWHLEHSSSDQSDLEVLTMKTLFIFLIILFSNGLNATQVFTDDFDNGPVVSPAGNLGAIWIVKFSLLKLFPFSKMVSLHELRDIW